MTHIAFLHKDFPLSGAEQVTIDVANYLCSMGYKVTVLVIHHRENNYPANTKQLFRVYQLPQGHVKRSGKVARAVRHFILTEQVSVLVTYRELLYARWLKKHTGVKLVYELHNTPGYEFMDLADKRRESQWQNLFYGCGVESLLARFYQKKYHRVYGWADAYGVLCEAYRCELAKKLRLDVDKNKIWVLPNSIATVDHINREKSKTMLYVGRLTHRDKRVDRLLRIWHQVQCELSDWQLKIVGDGKAANDLKQLASQLGLERCSFEGYTTRVGDYYDEASILCLTSSFEGWPMCVAEAQARGVVPVLFNSFSAAEDMVSDVSEGLLIPPYDEPLFAQQLTALANDGERLRQMQAAVVRKASTYTIERTGKAWIAMFNQLLSPTP